MIIYKNVDYGIYAYQIGFFKVKRIGEIVWSDHYDSKNEKFYLRIEGFYVAEERRRHGLGRKLLNKTIKQNLNENYPYMIVYPKTFGEKILKDNETLYRIYEHLGFYFTEEMVDRTKANNEMRYDFTRKLVDCLEKCLIYGHIRRFAD